VPRDLVALDALRLAEATLHVEVLQRGQVLVHGGRGTLGHADEVGAVVAHRPVLRGGVVQRVSIGPCVCSHSR
jgi:hypothetical protein